MDGVGAVAPATLSADKATAEYTVTLSSDPESTTAVNTLKNGLRPQAHAAVPPGTYALVGGTTAVFADIQAAMNHDYAIVFPIAAVIILLILMLLLRSLVAPWYLMVAVGLSFGATLGATVLVFQTLAGQSGLVPAASGRRCGQARRPGHRVGRADPVGHVRVADPGRELDPGAGRLRSRQRHCPRGVRDGYVLLPQPYCSHR
jgi:MMPL family